MKSRLFWVDFGADFKPSIFKQDKGVWFSGVEMPENAVRQSLSAFQIVILLRMIPNSYAVKAIFRRKSRLLRIHLSVAVWWLKIKLKKTVLFHTRCGRNQEKRVTQSAPHLRNEACNRSASRGRNGKSINTEAGGRFTRTHNFRDNRNVLCQAKHGYADGYYEWIWIVIDAFLMMYQTDCVDCAAQSEQKTVRKWKSGVRKRPCAVVLSIWKKQVKSRKTKAMIIPTRLLMVYKRTWSCFATPLAVPKIWRCYAIFWPLRHPRLAASAIGSARRRSPARGFGAKSTLSVKPRVKIQSTTKSA